MTNNRIADAAKKIDVPLTVAAKQVLLDNGIDADNESVVEAEPPELRFVLHTADLPEYRSGERERVLAQAKQLRSLICTGTTDEIFDAILSFD